MGYQCDIFMHCSPAIYLDALAPILNVSVVPWYFAYCGSIDLFSVGGSTGCDEARNIVLPGLVFSS